MWLKNEGWTTEDMTKEWKTKDNAIGWEGMCKHHYGAKYTNYSFSNNLDEFDHTDKGIDCDKYGVMIGDLNYAGTAPVGGSIWFDEDKFYVISAELEVEEPDFKCH